MTKNQAHAGSTLLFLSLALRLGQHMTTTYFLYMVSKH